MDDGRAECSSKKYSPNAVICENESTPTEFIIPPYNSIQIQTTLSPSAQRRIQNWSMAFITLQQAVNPLMVRYAHRLSEIRGAQFLASTTVFVTEMIRIILCSCLLYVNLGSMLSLSQELRSAFLRNKSETLKISIPALIYVIQNNLYFYALKRVNATLFSITYQLRILTTAVLTKVLLGRVFSAVQWCALCISFAGVILVQLSSQLKNPPAVAHTAINASLSISDERINQSVIAEAAAAEDAALLNSENAVVAMFGFDQNVMGLITVLVMCWTSAFAGVYLEGVLKSSSCDILMQNIRLSVITLPFAILTMTNDRKIIIHYGLFYGWSWMVWLIALLSAVGGIVVAVVMKYADNIRKSYCQSVALGGTALLSIVAGDARFSFGLVAGVALVIASIFLYTLYPPRPPTHTLLPPDDIDNEEHEVFSSDSSEVEDAIQDEPIQFSKRSLIYSKSSAYRTRKYTT